MHGFFMRTGSRSMPFLSIIDPDKPAPTLHAIDYGKIGVATLYGIRPLSLNEVAGLMGLSGSDIDPWCDEKRYSYRTIYHALTHSVVPITAIPAIQSVLPLLRKKKPV